VVAANGSDDPNVGLEHPKMTCDPPRLASRNFLNAKFSRSLDGLDVLDDLLVRIVASASAALSACTQHSANQPGGRRFAATACDANESDVTHSFAVDNGSPIPKCSSQNAHNWCGKRNNELKEIA
jgi:hypothetical protein